MFKNFAIALVLGMLQIPAQGAVTKIEMQINGQTKEYKGVLIGTGVAQFDKPEERFPIHTTFRHRFQEGEVGYEYTPWENIPLRRVEDHPAVATIKFKELKVKISTVEDNQDVATGSLLAIELKTWTLRFSYPVAKDASEVETQQTGATTTHVQKMVKQLTIRKYLNDLMDKFPMRKMLHPEGQDFNLLGWNKLHGTVLDREIGFTRGGKLVLTVTFGISKASKVRKNGSTDEYDVYHVSGLNDDTGILASDSDKILRDIFQVGDLIQYTSREEKDGSARNIALSPLRLVTSLGTSTNDLVFGKPMVIIMYGEGKELVGTLFAADSTQDTITVEVKYTKEITEDLVASVVKQGSKYVIKPDGKGLLAEAEYIVGGKKGFAGDGHTDKLSARIPLDKDRKN